MENIYPVLKERGFIDACSDELLELELSSGPVTFYAGFDPTSDSLHVGSLFVIMTMAWMQRFGHRPIALVGGGTGRIGDPSGRTKERQLLTDEILAANIEGIREQLAKFLRVEGREHLPPWWDASRAGDIREAALLDNGEWLCSYPLVDFLRDVGKHFRIGDMLNKESVKVRMKGEGLSFTEFSYILLQSYDFLHLFDRFGCRLQIGGSDQWGNITAGLELVRRLRGEKTFGLTIPLIVSSSGVKFGKTSEGENIWLDAKRTSPYTFYQFWINTDDRDVIRYLKYFTFLSLDDIHALEASLSQHPERREAHKALAWEVTALVHGRTEAERAKASAEALFAKKEEGAFAIPPGVPSSTLEKTRLEAGIPLVDLLVECGLCPSKREARTVIGQGAVHVNGERITEPARSVAADVLRDGVLLVRRGKKDYHLFRVS